HAAAISGRNFAFPGPASLRLSACATGILPRSSTSYPRAPSFAPRPATRTAEGPISTPRLPCPRSSGAPIISTRGFFMSSRLQSVQHSRKCDRLSYVFEPAHPCYAAFDPHAEATMRNRSVFAQIDIPVECFFRQMMFFNSPQQQLRIVNALAPADDLSISFGRQHVHPKRHLWPRRIRLHIKCLDRGRKTIHHNRLLELLRQDRLV